MAVQLDAKRLLGAKINSFADDVERAKRGQFGDLAEVDAEDVAVPANASAGRGDRGTRQSPAMVLSHGHADPHGGVAAQAVVVSSHDSPAGRLGRIMPAAVAPADGTRYSPSPYDTRASRPSRRSGDGRSGGGGDAGGRAGRSLGRGGHGGVERKGNEVIAMEAVLDAMAAADRDAVTVSDGLHAIVACARENIPTVWDQLFDEV